MIDNGRTTSGTVHECFGATKRLYRKVSRRYINNTQSSFYSEINTYYNSNQSKRFWNKINLKNRKSPAQTSLSASTFATHYSRIMSDDRADMTDDHRRICQTVQETFDCHKNKMLNVVVSEADVDQLIAKLSKNCAPGIDGITTEHLLYGRSSTLLSFLANLYTCILCSNTIPQIFQVGVIIPLLKKSTLDPNSTNSYRPITLSSTHAKMIELFMKPEDDVCSSQFGFRAKRSTAMAGSFLNDILMYFKSKKSSVYICSLDAEKCFDRIWHEGLFHKLYNRIALNYWLFLYKWYKSSSALVRYSN